MCVLEPRDAAREEEWRGADEATRERGHLARHATRQHTATEGSVGETGYREVKAGEEQAADGGPELGEVEPGKSRGGGIKTDAGGSMRAH